MVQKIGQKILGTVLIIISVFFIIPWQYSASVLGVIVDRLCSESLRISTNSLSTSTSCSYVIDYNVNNINYKLNHTGTIDGLQERNKGDQVEVFYKPSEPAKAMVNKSVRWIIGIILVIIGIILLV